MSNKAYHRTHCKVCGDKITDGTQFSTCTNHRRGWNKRKVSTCPCGKPAENIRSKYCSEACRKKWGIKPPVRTVTHVCQTCGDTFERPHFYPGKKMFCSLKCSNEQHSRKRAQHYRFGNVVLNSGYELRFIACMIRFDVIWAPWPDDKPFVHDGHEYRPDFLVNGRAIEVKGWEPEDHPQRAMRAAWDRSEPLVVVDEDALKLLEVGCNVEDILTPLNS